MPNLRSIGIQALKSWGYADDEAYQEALITLWKVSDRERVTGSLIRTILKNAEIDRKKTKKVEYVPIEYEAKANQDFNLGWFFDLTGRLKHKQRRMLYQSYVQDYTHPEMAEIYGLPVGTIKSKLHRICKRLEKINDY